MIYALTSESFVLDDNFKVLVDENNQVVYHDAPGITIKKLPTINEFQNAPGCYLLCYSESAQHSVYQTNDGDYVVGQIRVPGRYVNQNCVPTNYEDEDIEDNRTFKRKCKKYFRGPCATGCKIETNTKKWFGTLE